MIRPGISSYAFGWAVNAGVFSPEDLLDVAVAQNLRVIQFGDHLPLHRFSQATLEALDSRAKQVGVEIETGARGLTREHLNTYIGISDRLGARLLRFVIDETGYEPGLDEVTAIIRDALPGLRRARVTLGIENHDRFPCATLRELVNTIADDHVGICLDTANSFGAGEGIHEVLQQLAPVCVNLHIKDYLIARVPSLMGFTITGSRLGDGMLPLSEVIRVVASFQRCRSAMIETWPPPEAEMAQTLEKEREWALHSVRVLRETLETIAATNSN